MTTIVAERFVGDLAPLHLGAREIHVWSIPIDVGDDALPWFNLPDERRRRGFFDGWTRKEAFVKALGRGLEVPLGTFRVAFRPGEIPAVRWRKDCRHERWSMFDVSPGEDYAAALAVRGDWRVIVREGGRR